MMLPAELGAACFWSTFPRLLTPYISLSLAMISKGTVLHNAQGIQGSLILHLVYSDVLYFAPGPHPGHPITFSHNFFLVSWL